MRTTAHFNLWLPTRLRLRIAALAAEHGLSVSEAARRCLRRGAEAWEQDDDRRRPDAPMLLRGGDRR